MKILLIIIQLIPVLIELLKAVEAAIPGEGKGEAKLAMVRGVIEAGYEGASEIWPSLEKVIAVIVKAFNATGVFSK